MNDKRLFFRILVSQNPPVMVYSSQRLSGNKFTSKLRDVSQYGIGLSVSDAKKFNIDDAITSEFEFHRNGFKLNSIVRRIDTANNIIGVEQVFEQNLEYENFLKDLYEEGGRGYFLSEVTAYLKDINIYGTGYFSRYFEWQGMAREEYFLSVKGSDLLIKSGIKLITKESWCEYINHCFLFDKILIKIQNKNITKHSFELIFTYYNNQNRKIIASGGNKIVFTDKTGKLIKIPQPIIDVIMKHQAL